MPRGKNPRLGRRNRVDLFDIIGPVMIGPSSSHTAGAARIGRIARLLLGEQPVEAHIGLWGSFQKTYQGHGTDRALIGGLLGMTFLMILLSSLYEPEETASQGRCPPHPVRPRPRVENAIGQYCADMNIALSYHKCRDDWKDDRSLAGLTEAKLLASAYRQVEVRYPEKCAAIERSLADIGTLEQAGGADPDAPANLTARMLGEIFVYRDDCWAVPMAMEGKTVVVYSIGNFPTLRCLEQIRNCCAYHDACDGDRHRAAYVGRT